MGARATVFVPGSIGNVGPGFDVLGLAVEGLGDKITVELIDGPSKVLSITGRDAASVPKEATANCAVIAAISLLRRLGDKRHVAVRIERALPLSGGLGASAAASVGGALAAVHAAQMNVSTDIVMAAALDGEAAVAGRHLDNIAPSLLGGLTICLGVEPPLAYRLPIQGEWWLALATPAMKLATKTARSVLPEAVPRAEFVTNMANTAALVAAFARGDHDLARLALVDVYAEPRRAPLIDRFAKAKRNALDAGALGCSISGAGPTIFSLCASEADARRVVTAMDHGFGSNGGTIHVARIALNGARLI